RQEKMVRVNSCCCGCSLKTGTILIGVYYLISYLLGVVILGIALGIISDPSVQKEIDKAATSDVTAKDLETISKGCDTNEVANTICYEAIETMNGNGISNSDGYNRDTGAISSEES
ncbi:hypothetical protein L9F63_007471, partial [Diploptera punctata]